MTARRGGAGLGGDGTREGGNGTERMKGRYELIDTHNPTWRGQRFTKLAAAERELGHSFPPGRFIIKDRKTREHLTTGDTMTDTTDTTKVTIELTQEQVKDLIVAVRDTYPTTGRKLIKLLEEERR